MVDVGSFSEFNTSLEIVNFGRYMSFLLAGRKGRFTRTRLGLLNVSVVFRTLPVLLLC